MNRQKRIIEVLLKDKVSKTVLDIVLTSMDLQYLDGVRDERNGKVVLSK